MSMRDFQIVYTHACSQSRRAQPNFVAFRRKDPTKWGLYLGSWSSLDQIWTTAAQLTTTDYNSRQLIEAGVTIGNVTQAVVMSCG